VESGRKCGDFDLTRHRTHNTTDNSTFSREADSRHLIASCIVHSACNVDGEHLTNTQLGDDLLTSDLVHASIAERSSDDGKILHIDVNGTLANVVLENAK
jgi:hypothetical protein